MRFHRISKRHARELFRLGKPFYIVSHKMMPGGSWGMGLTVFPTKYHEENRSFDQMVIDWNYYNGSYETGYYPTFYLESQDS
jgi:hypothetical protein